MEDKIINSVKLEISDDNQGVGYLYLPGHPKLTIPGLVKRTVSISKLLENYNGVPLYLDFDKNNKLIGIEICE